MTNSINYKFDFDLKEINLNFKAYFKDETNNTYNVFNINEKINCTKNFENFQFENFVLISKIKSKENLISIYFKSNKNGFLKINTEQIFFKSNEELTIFETLLFKDLFYYENKKIKRISNNIMNTQANEIFLKDLDNKFINSKIEYL